MRRQRLLLQRRTPAARLYILSIVLMASTPHTFFAFTHPLQPRRSLPLARNSLIKVSHSAVTVPSTEDDSKDIHGGSGLTSSSRRSMGVSISLALVYFTVMAAKCALPATLSLLTDPKTGLTMGAGARVSQQQMQQVFAKILFTSTSAIAVGKLLLGPVIDHFGGVLSLQVSLLLLSALLAVISTCQSVSTFAICWVLVDFIFSSCWAACINAIHQCFPQDDWAKQIAQLAAAARTGNAAAFAVFASLLSYFSTRAGQAWRPIFAVSAVMQLVPVALLIIFGSTAASRKKKPSQKVDKIASAEERPSLSSGGPMHTLRREACTVEFWCHLTSRSLLMVFASFLLFVPTLLNQVYSASSATAARVGSLYAIGCLISVMAGSSRYARLSRRNKIVSLISLLSLATLSSIAQLGHVMGAWSLSLTASALSMFAWGFSFALPFYIPPSLFALKRGGTESSATIADVFDIGGFALLAGFNGFVAGISHADKLAWIPVFQMTTFAAAVAMAAVSVATWREDASSR